MGKPIRVLIAEDEAIIALDLKRKLESFGHVVLATVRTGEDAIAKSHELAPDLVLMDIGLKGTTSGLNAAVSLRGSMKTPVVFVTAYSDQATKTEMEKVGSTCFVAKPIGADELRYSIDNFMKSL
jgi:two-component system, response regulator PdtaR